MKNLKLFFGLRKWGRETMYLTPTIYTVILKSKFEKRHSFSIEFQWIFFGFGFKFFWKNKTVEPIPDLSGVFS